MLLPESVLEGLGFVDTQSELKIYCKQEDREVVKTAFIEVFTSKWNAALDKTEEEYGGCHQKEHAYNPINHVNVGEGCVIVNLSAPAIYSKDELCFDAYAGDDALEESLEQIKEEYEDITIEGYIGYSWSDMTSGECVQYELPEGEDNSDKVYESIGHAIAKAVQEDEEYFLERVLEPLMDLDPESEDDEEMEEVCQEIAQWLKAYAEYLPEGFFEKLVDILNEENEIVADCLEMSARDGA